MSRTIGIDQSLTNTAVWLDLENHRLISTKPNKEDPLDSFKRAIYIAQEIHSFCSEHSVKIDKIQIEGLSYGAFGDATRTLAGLQFIIVEHLMKLGKDIEIITPTSLKKLATDDGRADKQKMFDCMPDDVKDVIGEVGKTKGRFDLCDAYWLSVVTKTK